MTTIKTLIINAKSVQKEWYDKPINIKIEFFKNLVLLIEQKQKYIVSMLNKEIGKPISEAESEVIGTKYYLKYLIKNIRALLKPESVKPTSLYEFFTKKSKLYFEPKGCIGIISSYNFPFSTLKYISSAIITGNSVIHKPSEYSTKIALIIQELFDETGFPKGLLNTLPGKKKYALALSKSDVDKIIFIGSTSTGKKIFLNSAKPLHPLMLELGGKDPAIVLKDSELDSCVRSIVHAAFLNAGQSCNSVKRIYVQDVVMQIFIQKVVEQTKKEYSTKSLGPIINKGVVEYLDEQLRDAIKKGAKILLGGSRKGQIFTPTIITGINQSMKILKEETFGPVLFIMEFKHVEESIQKANDSKYGLSASVWTSDIKKARYIASKLKCGTVWINDILFESPATPIGGTKQSGFGKHFSKYGLLEFIDIKCVITNRFPRFQYAVKKAKRSLLEYQA